MLRIFLIFLGVWMLRKPQFDFNNNNNLEMRTRLRPHGLVKSKHKQEMKQGRTKNILLKERLTEVIEIRYYFEHSPLSEEVLGFKVARMRYVDVDLDHCCVSGVCG